MVLNHFTFTYDGGVNMVMRGRYLYHKGPVTRDHFGLKTKFLFLLSMIWGTIYGELFLNHC